MNNKGIYGAIAVTFIIAVVALFTPVNQMINKLGATGPTTNLPSLGLANLYVGSGCDQQSNNQGLCTAYQMGSTSPESLITAGGIYAVQGITEGGLDAFIATSTTAFLGQLDLQNSSLVAFTLPAGGNTTVILPNQASLTTFLPNPGDITSLTFYNSHATSTITVSGSTGVNLLSASSSAVIQPTKVGNLKFIRLPNFQVDVTMSVAN